MAVTGEKEPLSGSLNPTWVCWLMGYPLTWFDGVTNPKESRASHTASKIECKNSVV